MKKVLVTGARSQLAQCLKDQQSNYDTIQLEFVSREAFDLTDREQMRFFLEQSDFDYCINTAAYTQVETAETEQEEAYQVNTHGVEDLAQLCEDSQITLLHISTDYVFDGDSDKPYREDDMANPINVYGTSKWEGEQAIRETLGAHYIVRTSWLYSPYGHNFYKSVLKWAREREELSITTDQLGTPTNAQDVARALLDLIDLDPKTYGTYHLSNSGQATWYDFAKAILELTGQLAEVKLVKTDHYPTFAARPKYSVLDCAKIEGISGIRTKNWRESLKELINKF